MQKKLNLIFAMFNIVMTILVNLSDGFDILVISFIVIWTFNLSKQRSEALK